MENKLGIFFFSNDDNQIFDKIAPLSPVYQEKLEEKEECKCDCGCKGDECKCKDNDVTKDIQKMPYDIPNYLIENNIHTLSDLVDFFIKYY